MNWYSTQQVAKKYGVSLRTAQRWAKNKDYQSFVRYHRGAYEFNEDFFQSVINNTTPNDNVASSDTSGEKASTNTTQNDNTKRQETTEGNWEYMRQADEIILPKDDYFELIRYITETNNYKSKYEELEKQSEARVQDLKETISNAHQDITFYRGQIANLQGQMDKLLMSARERNLIDYTSLQKDITTPETTPNDTQNDNVAEAVVLDNDKDKPKLFKDWLNDRRERH